MYLYVCIYVDKKVVTNIFYLNIATEKLCCYLVIVEAVNLFFFLMYCIPVHLCFVKCITVKYAQFLQIWKTLIIVLKLFLLINFKNT